MTSNREAGRGSSNDVSGGSSPGLGKSEEFFGESRALGTRNFTQISEASKILGDVGVCRSPAVSVSPVTVGHSGNSKGQGIIVKDGRQPRTTPSICYGNPAPDKVKSLSVRPAPGISFSERTTSSPLPPPPCAPAPPSSNTSTGSVTSSGDVLSPPSPKCQTIRSNNAEFSQNLSVIKTDVRTPAFHSDGGCASRTVTTDSATMGHRSEAAEARAGPSPGPTSCESGAGPGSPSPDSEAVDGCESRRVVFDSGPTGTDDGATTATFTDDARGSVNSETVLGAGITLGHAGNCEAVDYLVRPSGKFVAGAPDDKTKGFIPSQKAHISIPRPISPSLEDATTTPHARSSSRQTQSGRKSARYSFPGVAASTRPHTFPRSCSASVLTDSSRSPKGTRPLHVALSSIETSSTSSPVASTRHSTSRGDSRGDTRLNSNFGASPRFLSRSLDTFSCRDKYATGSDDRFYLREGFPGDVIKSKSQILERPPSRRRNLKLVPGCRRLKEDNSPRSLGSGEGLQLFIYDPDIFDVRTKIESQRQGFQRDGQPTASNDSMQSASSTSGNAEKSVSGDSNPGPSQQSAIREQLDNHDRGTDLCSRLLNHTKDDVVKQRRWMTNLTNDVKHESEELHLLSKARGDQFSDVSCESLCATNSCLSLHNETPQDLLQARGALATAPSIHITSATTVDAYFTTPEAVAVTQAIIASGVSVIAASSDDTAGAPSGRPPVPAATKLRGSLINGLRRLSREKNTFLRVDGSYAPCKSTEPNSDHHHRVPSRTFLFPGTQTDSDSHQARSGRLGVGERKKLRVEFAVMEGEGHKLNRAKFRGGSGELSMKDEIENDVAMLGGNTARFRQPRVSLLGKPLNYRAHRRDMRYRRLQSRIYNFLERPKNWGSWMYHFVMFAFIILCLTLGVLSSITEWEGVLIQSTIFSEVVMVLWIAVELTLRVWSAGCRSRYQGMMGRLRFLRRLLCIIDICLVVASCVIMIIGSTQEFPQTVLSALRFFQIARMVRMDRKGGTWKLLGSVVWAHRQELVTTLYIGLLGLIFSSYLVYIVEKDEPRIDAVGPKQQFNNTGYKPKFNNFADAIWWGVVTLCTVGYGDVVPASWGGKVIASFSAILGISFFALPAGILGSGFALKVQQQQRQKHLNRRRVPAANLIQCLWRCYAADEHSISTATWRPHMIPCPSPTSERTFKNNTSFVSRFSTRRRDRSSTVNSSSSQINGQAQSPLTTRHHSRRTAISTSEEEVPNVLDRSHLSLATGLTDHKLQLDTLPFKKENSVSSIGKESEEEADLSPRLTQLTEQHKKAIRAIRKIRYFVARRKFREALRPYDVKDVIEQYSAGHVDMLGRIKNLQGRLDQILGRQGSKSKDVYESKVCLASRIVKVERQVDDIESKLDLLVDMYKEDRKLLLQHIQQSYGVTPPPGQPPMPPPTSHAPPPAGSSQFRPRPILIDKHFTSEPATPTGLGFASSTGGRLGEKPIIQRNLSDLSQRIKKRVTYRGLSLHDPPSRAQSAANFSSSIPLYSLVTSNPSAPTNQNDRTTVDIDRLLSLTSEGRASDLHSSSDMSQTSNEKSFASMSSRDFSQSGGDPNEPPQQQQQTYHQPQTLPSPLLPGTTLSTLSEQRSVESDSSLSCLDLASSPQGHAHFSPEPSPLLSSPAQSPAHSSQATPLRPHSPRPGAHHTGSFFSLTSSPHSSFPNLATGHASTLSGHQQLPQPSTSTATHVTTQDQGVALRDNVEKL